MPVNVQPANRTFRGANGTTQLEFVSQPARPPGRFSLRAHVVGADDLAEAIEAHDQHRTRF